MRNIEQWLEEQRLAKTVSPSHFRGLVSTMDKAGERLVNFDAQSRDISPQLSHLPDTYREDVTENPKPAKRQFDNFSGATKKIIYGGASGKMYMLKPYHEAVTDCFRNFMRFPFQGWSELANQALYHAGSIGHLHQQVHAQNHDTDRVWSKVPMLVIHMDKNAGDEWDANKMLVPCAQDARKVGVMDFLTNNLDRHTGNLLVNGDSTSLLAIDHGRSFQYMNNLDNKWSSWGSATDTLRSYLPEYGKLSFDKGAGFSPSSYRDIFEDWWSPSSEEIAREFDRQIGYIKDPDVRDHLKANFYARKDVLDGIASSFPRNFLDSRVAIHQPSKDVANRYPTKRDPNIGSF